MVPLERFERSPPRLSGVRVRCPAIGRWAIEMVGGTGLEPASARLPAGDSDVELTADGRGQRIRTATGSLPERECCVLPSPTIDWYRVRDSNPRHRFVGPRPCRLDEPGVGSGPRSRTELNRAYETRMLPRASARRFGDARGNRTLLDRLRTDEPTAD
jgi:hypothetical protein